MSERIEWTDADRARHRKIRELFKDRPTIDELIARGELSRESVPMGVYVTARVTAARLRAAREAAGLSRAELAESAGVAEADLAALESGELFNPTLELLARYAGALGMTVSIGLEAVQT
jgi:DNA-binding XRE family transcriptional regulator